jgi:TraM recognition site of TraD and TraG
MTSVLGNAVLAFLESEQGGTLADLRRFLIEPEFRKSVLKTVRDPEIVYYWQKEFPLLSGKPQGPLLTRLDTFLRPKLIRYMVVQKENKLDFRNIMDEGKIFLAKLAQGAIGEENAYLLGTLIVSKLNQLVLSRQEQRESERRNFYLYIDEFQNFITPSMASILSGARKYRLGLVLAHQDLRQLSSEDSQVASSVISNPYTRVCFRLGDQDARRLADGFSFFEAKDLQNLGTGEAICRVERAEYDFNLKSLPLPKVDPDVAETRRNRLITLSREKYGTPRAIVEEFLRKKSAAGSEKQSESTSEKEETGYEKQEAEPESEPIYGQPPPEEPHVEETQTSTESFTVKPERPTRKQPKPTPGTPQPLGKGGRQHKYLQDMVKRLAEDKGFRATIEKPVLGGKGSIDVALEKNGRAIACEISVRTSSEQEFGNLQKCLAAGFDRVFLLSQENKNLTAIMEVASNNLEKNDLDKVSFFTIEDFIGFLEEEEAKSQETEEIIGGRKVRVRHRALSEAERKARRQAIAQTILQAMKRMKPKD